MLEPDRDAESPLISREVISAIQHCPTRCYRALCAW